MRAYERLIRYTRFATASNEMSESCPSTPSQYTFAEFLEQELIEIGAENVTLDDNGYVYAVIPATVEGEDIPSIGFIAHVDVSDAAPCEGVETDVIHYEGGDILLSSGEKMTEREFSSLRDYKGKHLVVTDGTTLLGADDKAGIAEIMTMAELLINNPDIPHGKICIGFTPDEEIGRGADRFDLDTFGADFAYTVDGAAFGEINYENFNAYSATVTVKGKSIHPGSAKNKLVNALELAMRFHAMLPPTERPEHTEGYEGFYHLVSLEGETEHATLRYILRDHDLDKVKSRVRLMEDTAAYLNGVCGDTCFTLETKESYLNMIERVRPHMHLIENAKDAIRRAGGEPFVQPIRGGTDGARLSFMGLPCPNLGTGSHNHHGRFEYACVEAMDACVDMLTNIAVIYAENIE